LEQGLLEKVPDSPQLKLDLSFTHASLGELWRDQGDYGAALGAYDKALALRHEVYASDPENAFAFGAVVRGHQSLSTVWALSGHLDRGLAEQQTMLSLRLAWEKKHPSQYGDAVWRAYLHEGAGELLFGTAQRAGLPEADRRTYLRRSCAEQTRALSVLSSVAGGRPLEGEHARATARIQGRLQECEAALAKAARR
jgi:tetratricopeptide (TPR) repeat protein